MLPGYGSLIPIDHCTGDEMAPEHMLFLNVLYTYFEDVKKYAKFKRKEVRAERFATLTSLANHDHTRNLCSVVGINHKFFLRTLGEAVAAAEGSCAQK